MAFCGNCGQKLEPGAPNCQACGASVVAEKSGLDTQAAMDAGKSFFVSLFDLKLREMITPKIIRFLFILGLIGYGIMALVSIIGGFINSFGTGLLMLILMPLVVVVGTILLRVYLELIVVLFNIYSELRQIRKVHDKAS